MNGGLGIDIPAEVLAEAQAVGDELERITPDLLRLAERARTVCTFVKTAEYDADIDKDDDVERVETETGMWRITETLFHLVGALSPEYGSFCAGHATLGSEYRRAYQAWAARQPTS